MSEDRLTLTERCVLLVLMAEAREMTNAELYAVAGVKLDGKYRRNLNDLGLVDSAQANRAFVHELTDRGAVWCGTELTRERPARSGPAGEPSTSCSRRCAGTSTTSIGHRLIFSVPTWQDRWNRPTRRSPGAAACRFGLLCCEAGSTDCREASSIGRSNCWPAVRACTFEPRRIRRR